jgi:hypothetical protein
VMKRAGWMILGYMAAVVLVTAFLVLLIALHGPIAWNGSLEFYSFFGRLVGGGIVVFVPIYLAGRIMLRLFSAKSFVGFALAFGPLCVLLLGGLAQVPDMWLVDWVPSPNDMPETVVWEALQNELWGGVGLGPFLFTGLSTVFWMLAGAVFGSAIWLSERLAVSSRNQNIVGSQ